MAAREYGHIRTRWCWVTVTPAPATGHELVTYHRTVHDEEQRATWLDPDSMMYHAWRNILDREGLRVLRTHEGQDRLLTPAEIEAAGPQFLDTDDNRRLSQHDKSILARTQAARWKRMNAGAGPEVGDKIKYNDGRVVIVSFETERFFQPSMGPGDGNCFIGECGGASFSGGLNHPVKAGVMRPDGRDQTQFLFFDEGIAGPGRAVRCDVEVNRWFLNLPSTYTPADLEVMGYAPKFNTD